MPHTALLVALVAAAACSTALALDRPVWPTRFTASAHLTGTTWSHVAPQDRHYTIEADQELRSIRLHDPDAHFRSPIRLLRPLSFSGPAARAGGDNVTEELYFFDFTADERQCDYTKKFSAFERVVADFVQGSARSAASTNSARMWFPSHMYRSSTPSSADGQLGFSLYETTSRSSPEPYVPNWRNTWGSVNYCNGSWQDRLGNQTHAGCDALRVTMQHQSVYSPDLVHEVHRVHRMAFATYDRDWEYRVKYDMKLSVAPSAFDLPTGWRSICRNLDQGFSVEPVRGWHSMAPMAPAVIRIALQHAPIGELGPVVVEFDAPSFVRVSPSRLTFTVSDWDEPREVVLEAAGVGSGRIVLRGRGGGFDLVGAGYAHVTALQVVAHAE